MVHEVWTEKYRPRKFEEVVGQEEIIKRVKSLTNSMNLPHLLFAGPAGTGKSTLALITVRELFGEGWRDNYLELNASDERGIGVVRGAIKDFSRTIPLGADFKIIFLDEADALTVDAQQALRRTMEKYTGTVRFILNANYSSKLITPIQSRCSLFKFKPLLKEDIKEYLKKITLNEKIEVDENAYDAIFDVCEGDMRTAINYLQAASSINDKVILETIYEVSNSAQPEDIYNMIDSCLSLDFLKARGFMEKLLFEQGLSGEDIINQIYKKLIAYPEDKIDITKKIKILDRIAEINFRLVEGANDRIQLEALLAQIILINSNK
jgi:replication factor C small subunit